jgi:hypothetical protein
MCLDYFYFKTQFLKVYNSNLTIELLILFLKINKILNKFSKKLLNKLIIYVESIQLLR